MYASGIIHNDIPYSICTLLVVGLIMDTRIIRKALRFGSIWESVLGFQMQNAWPESLNWWVLLEALEG